MILSFLISIFSCCCFNLFPIASLSLSWLPFFRQSNLHILGSETSMPHYMTRDWATVCSSTPTIQCYDNMPSKWFHLQYLWHIGLNNKAPYRRCLTINSLSTHYTPPCICVASSRIMKPYRAKDMFCMAKTFACSVNPSHWLENVSVVLGGFKWHVDICWWWCTYDQIGTVY